MASATMQGRVCVANLTSIVRAVDGNSNVSQPWQRTAFFRPASFSLALPIVIRQRCTVSLTKAVGFRLRTEAVAMKDRVAQTDHADPMRPVVVIDNYDSFTYNLCQYLGDLGCKIEVHRNDEITVEELRAMNPRGILISPGPGTPQDSGISLEIVQKLGPSIPLFGVCMGLQCMGEAFGGKIVRAPNGVMHGKTSPVFYDEKGEPGLLDGLPSPFTACRYHSLVIEEDTFPSDQLEITAWTEDGLVMGVRHRVYKHIQGVQFHPESIRTENGMKIVGNFLKMLERKEAADEENAASKVMEIA